MRDVTTFISDVFCLSGSGPCLVIRSRYINQIHGAACGGGHLLFHAVTRKHWTSIGIGIGKAEKCTNWESKKWMTMKFDSRRFLLVIQRPLVSTDWMVKVENPQSFCHLISYRNRIFVSKSLLLPLPRQSPTQWNCRICVLFGFIHFKSRDFPVCHLHYWHSNSERAKFFSHFLLHLVKEIILSTETESQILIRWPRRWGILCSHLGCWVAMTNIWSKLNMAINNISNKPLTHKHCRMSIWLNWKCCVPNMLRN